MPECEQRLMRACLAALARRAEVPLVIAYEEIEWEYSNGGQIQCACDGDARCVRISVAEVKA